MKYITIKRFKQKSMSGEVNIPYGTECDCFNNIIFYNNKPICYITSQNAYDYFANNNDNCGIQRGNLIQLIIAKLSKHDNNYQKRWNKIWDDIKLRKFKRNDIEDNYWLWNFDFYNATIKDLEYIWNKIK